MKLQYAAITHPGNVREKNEDNFYINGIWRQDVLKPAFFAKGESDGAHLLAAVCDGMGGHAMGEIASLYATEILDTYAQETEGVFFASPQEFITEANDKICKLMEQEKKRIGTTFAAVEFQNDMVTAVNLGDSRIYRMRQGEFLQLSKDHTTVARLLEDGLLSEEEAKTYPLRHQVTQHLGIPSGDMVLEPAVTGVMPIVNGDTYLLCSDGLTDMLTEKVIAAELEQAREVDSIVQRLVQAAVDAGGRDNITAVIVRAKGAGSLGEKIKERFSWNIG
ncbi:MAG: SpoIIE family protein phosphatase [Hespellia sp.]|nr:SpoIIE family protein phosphatase [Hespellia sp.]